MAIAPRIAGLSPDAWQRHRPLLKSLFKREVSHRYKGSILGLAWTFVAPLTVMIAYSIVFHYVYRVVDISFYPLFLLSGMVAWFFFAGAAQGSASSLVANGNLVKKVRFPRELIPLSVVGGHAVTALSMLVVLIPINLIFVADSRSTALLALPVGLLFLSLLTIGFSLLLSALNVYFRDVEHILLALLLPWFFLTPIFYTPDQLPSGAEQFQWLAAVLEWGNPIAPFVTLIRDSIFFGVWSSPAVFIYCAVVGVGTLVLGIWAFRRLEAEMAVEL
ncbi:MAG: ABC transporter permease [Miltoncostaeaceae bacterium]